MRTQLAVSEAMLQVVEGAAGMKEITRVSPKRGGGERLVQRRDGREEVAVCSCPAPGVDKSLIKRDTRHAGW